MLTRRLEDLLEAQRGLIVVPVSHGGKALDGLALNMPRTAMRQIWRDGKVVDLCR